MKISDKAAEAARVVDVCELVERIHKALDHARLLGQLSPTMVREGDDGPVIVKMGSQPVAVKAHTEDELRAMADAAGIPWKDGYEERVVDVWASDERVDRDGDIIEQGSWKFDNFAKNPLVLWGHEWETPPIGNAISWGVEDRKDDDYEGPALRLVELFAPSEASPQAESVLRLAKAGFLRSGSVGFFPGKIVSFENDEDREELGIPEGGYLLQDCELIEHSHVSVPANPGALNILAAAKSAGGLSPIDIVTIRELARQDSLVIGREDVWSRADSTLRGMWAQLFPDVAIESHRSLAERVAQDSAVERIAPVAKTNDKGETPSADGETPLAAEDTSPAEGDTPSAEGGDEKTSDERIGDLEGTIEDLAKAVSDLTTDLGGIKSAVADLRSDVDGARREGDQEKSAQLSGLLGDLSENTKKALVQEDLGR